MAFFRLDGREYPIPDLSALTWRESQMVKRVTGLTQGQIEEAFTSGDTDAMLSLFVVAKYRQDKGIDIDALLDSPVIALEVVLEPGDEGYVSPDGPAPEADEAPKDDPRPPDSES